MAELRYDGRVAIITGAGRGLGQEYARLLASRGARVVVNDLPADAGEDPQQGPARLAAQEIRDLGGNAVADENSIATAEGGAAVVQSAIAAFGRVDIVVNNAGNMSDDFAETLAVHLFGAYWVTKPAFELMMEQHYGRILNITSGVGLFGSSIPTRVSDRNGYTTAKAGIVGLTTNLAIQGSAHNVKANALAPLAGSRRGADLPAAIQEWNKHFEPRHVAPVVAWLTHEDCPVSGEIYSAGGGRVARVFVGETLGYANPSLTPEDVRDNSSQIRDAGGYFVPRGISDELDIFGKMLPAGPFPGHS